MGGGGYILGAAICEDAIAGFSLSGVVMYIIEINSISFGLYSRSHYGQQFFLAAKFSITHFVQMIHFAGHI